MGQLPSLRSRKKENFLLPGDDVIIALEDFKALDDFAGSGDKRLI
jgi:hypothetical protein